MSDLHVGICRSCRLPRMLVSMAANGNVDVFFFHLFVTHRVESRDVDVLPVRRF